MAIATGRLRKGDKLCRLVRQLAVDLRINANTVAKVYGELERARKSSKLIAVSGRSSRMREVYGSVVIRSREQHSGRKSADGRSLTIIGAAELGYSGPGCPRLSHNSDARTENVKNPLAETKAGRRNQQSPRINRQGVVAFPSSRRGWECDLRRPVRRRTIGLRASPRSLLIFERQSGRSSASSSVWSSPSHPEWPSNGKRGLVVLRLGRFAGMHEAGLFWDHSRDRPGRRCGSIELHDHHQLCGRADPDIRHRAGERRRGASSGWSSTPKEPRLKVQD